MSCQFSTDKHYKNAKKKSECNGLKKETRKFNLRGENIAI